eukprot:TRINITY_DN15157_c0_g1_i1.p1 TRINITY_DN15157_c0_g1~~TRINITY_DN15157_c0_g1_i1.p1  ORF type:complete len:156 (+),score=32.97 TRINITY_DN15157_c0_g1_i1:137-604(+)
MSVFASKPKAQLPKIEPDAEGRFDVGPLSSLPTHKGKRFELGEREVAVFVIDNIVHAIDAHCYHAGGPLEAADIEDVGERTCLKCPWHGYVIDIRTGEGINAAQASCSSKGVKQRVHKATVTEEQTVLVELDLAGERNSDYYSSDLYLKMMGKKR